MFLVIDIASANLGEQHVLLCGFVIACALSMSVIRAVATTARAAVTARGRRTSPVVLISHGVMREDALSIECITPEELYGAMREQGIQELAQVQSALLEADGHISFVRTNVASRVVSTSPHPRVGR